MTHHRDPDWPRPPAALPASLLDRPPQGAVVTVAGLVLVRQRPGTAKGVIFITLEDETGVVNVVIWSKIYEAFRRAVVAARLLRVTGRIQRDGPVVHVVATRIEDLSPLLDTLASGRTGSGEMGQPVNTYDARAPKRGRSA
ncbi:MAG: OB-fold nucleic acid binding domain-containing protein [Pseudomonadota bacterium]